jgi:hypothetical protein
MNTCIAKDPGDFSKIVLLLPNHGFGFFNLQLFKLESS